jgi:4-diphosphocytidyl-2-C-methyl-D-erythritol kinase
MILFPNAKINLGLHIIRKRSDGYHDIETFFCPVNLCDALEIIPQKTPAESAINVKFSCTGISVEGKTADNICLKAWHLLKKDYPGLPPVQMHLHKVIPTGAGLGGGSSDGAFTLQLLNKLFNLQVPETKLSDYAFQLGSDCPFFLLNKPCFAQGRGEQLEPLGIDLSGYEILLINPGIHISTAKAFSGVSPCVPEKSIYGVVQQPVSTWRQELANDFEQTVFPLYPSLKEIRDTLYDSGAVYASMTGSGSAIYGLFEKNKMPDPAFPFGYRVFRLRAVTR